MSYYTEQMQIVRDLVSMNNKLRQQQGVPLSQQVLNIAYGGDNPDNYYLMPEFREELAKACEVVDLGYDLGDLINIEHHNNLGEVPTRTPAGDPWTCLEEDGMYFCIDLTTPDWLHKRHEERKAHQKEMKERKAKGLIQM